MSTLFKVLCIELTLTIVNMKKISAEEYALKDKPLRILGDELIKLKL